MLDWNKGEISTRKLVKKLLCLYLVQDMLHQIKAQQFYTDLDPWVLKKIVEFKDFSRVWWTKE